MPQASETSRARMIARFGSLGFEEPTKYLEERGYRRTYDSRWIPRPGVLTLDEATREEQECILFLVHEWDEGGLVHYEGEFDRDKLTVFLADTHQHVADVKQRMEWFAYVLLQRANYHDESKFMPVEAYTFSSLAGLPKVDVGTEEYERRRSTLGDALDHHYLCNDHHPEHWQDKGGISAMTLPALMEMLCDWHAAWSRRAASGTFADSFAVMVERFRIPPVLESVLRATCLSRKWFDEPKTVPGHDPDSPVVG